jgi:hypothetical protein
MAISRKLDRWTKISFSVKWLRRNSQKTEEDQNGV